MLARVLVLVLATVLSVFVVPAAPVAAAPIQLSPGPGQGALTVVAAVGNTVYSAWQDGSYSFVASERILFSRSDDGGRTFSSPEPLSIFGGHHPSIAAFGTNVYVAWEQWTARDSPGAGAPDIWVAASADGGRAFGAAERLDRDTYDSKDPHVVATSAGGFIAWADMHGDVYLAHTVGAGSPWTINRVATACGGCYAAFGVEIAADGPNVAVAWRSAGVPSAASDVKAAFSADSGATIVAPIAVSNSPATQSSWPHVAVSGVDVHVAWEENPPRRRMGHRDGRLCARRRRLVRGPVTLGPSGARRWVRRSSPGTASLPLRGTTVTGCRSRRARTAAPRSAARSAPPRAC